MRIGKELLTIQFDEMNIDETKANVTKCLEKLKTYSGKVEIQSEKLSAAMEESDAAEIEKVLDEDCLLCSNAMDIYLDLMHYKEKLMSVKEKIESKAPLVEASNTSKLIELQRSMQQLLESQMKQKETSTKKEPELSSFVKLPKIEMISFNGEKTKWVEFWDSFQSAVHSNNRLSNVEKFNYLKSKVLGEARRAIAGLALSDENYPVAVDILTKRFGNPQEIVDMHYNQLINMQSTTNKVSSLRYFLDNVERHLRGLEVLHQNVNQDVFVSIIRSKLPEDVLLQLEIQNGVNEKWKVSSLCERLRNYVVARERATKVTKNLSDRTGSSGNTSPMDKSFTNRKTVYENMSVPQYNSSAQALVTTSSKPNSNEGKSKSSMNKCRYCQENHWSDECKKYATINERKDRIKGSCFKCLNGGHSFKECKTNKVCVYCGEMNVHHRSLCPKKFQYKQSVTHLVNEIENADEVNEENGLMSLSEMVLMQTALTEVKNPETMETTQVRLILDSGSHRSYISEHLAQELSLKSDGEQDIHIVTFGSKTSKRITTKFTKLDVKLKNGKHNQITANIEPLISGELQRRPLKDLSSDSVKDLVSSVELADVIPKESETSPIELLIGNDYYLDFIHGEKIEIQSGLYLLASKLGWILSGRTMDTNEDTCESSMLVITYGSNINKSNTFTSIDASLPPKTELEDFWNMESIGIVDKPTNTDDVIAMEKFQDTLEYKDNRYQVTWPLKDDDPDLPTNKELALGRLNILVNRMKHKPELLRKYDQVMSDQLHKGIIEKVYSRKSDGVVHYIPHHPVITPEKSTT
ncbi:MAG: DUF1759 domain-containing protein [Candidatus Thiodiazotropha endolucinida]|nr:DUF1759 domain-containing protein [Candidatus Thiodiazotropha taylori]MCW4342336.1 DUF1759 domain-containing protein [Candidatus Thiodiazotropha endolucinida]